MKTKIKITTNNQSITRLVKILHQDEIKTIKYIEQPNINVELKVSKDQLTISKTGIINTTFTHKINQTKKLNYKINQSGTILSGDSMITTTQLDINQNKIKLDFIRDDEKIKIIWEY